MESRSSAIRTDVFVPGGVRTVLRPLLRRRMTNDIRRQCARACAVAYVTADFLQRRYPASPAAYVASYTCLDLSDEAFVCDPRPMNPRGDTRHIVFVGSLEQMYKAPDVLIDAVAAACDRGGDLRLTVVGDGKHRGELEARADARGLANRVRFLGHLPSGDAVRKELDAADLFVLPSRTEGLPRALIEAMARALPCIGSSVGGIPELLSPSEQVPPGDVDALATKILEILGDRERCCRLSHENLQRARDYHVDALRPRRRASIAPCRRRRPSGSGGIGSGGTSSRLRLRDKPAESVRSGLSLARDRRGSGGETVGAVRVQGVSCLHPDGPQEMGKGTRARPARCTSRSVLCENSLGNVS